MLVRGIRRLGKEFVLEANHPKNLNEMVGGGVEL